MIIKIFFIKIIFFWKTLCVLSQKLSADIIPTDYDRDITPTVDGRHVDVNVSIVILSLSPDKGASMSFNVDLFYQLYWTDYRLRGPVDKKVTLSSDWKQLLWLPDTYFRNAISGSVANVFSPSFYFTLTNGTQVFMAARLQMKLSCDMEFRKFPFDSQICFINITTLSQTVQFVRLYWQSFRVGSHVDLPEFIITDESTGVCTKDFSKIGSYSCLYVVIHLRRNIGNYLIKRYVPSFLIVIMTFIGFWIPTQVTPARVSLIITALLALIAQQIQGEISLSYIYALEVWTIICIVFVFATLIEYAIAISWKQTENNRAIDQNIVINNNIYNKLSISRWFIFLKPDQHNCAVDGVSRIVFPIAFSMAIIIYSLCYYFT